MKTALTILFITGSLSGITGYIVRTAATGPAGVDRVARPSQDEMVANGVVEGSHPEIALRPLVTGTIAAIHFREGQPVSRGSVLVELNSETQTQQVALAEAERSAAQAEYTRLRNGERLEKRKAVAALESACRATYLKAKADYERAQRLASSQSVSAAEREASYYKMVQAQAELEQAAAQRELTEAPARSEDLAAAAARVAAAEARVRLAEAELAKTRLLAPSDGCILQTYAEPGELAGPTSARPVLLFANISRYRVRAFVEELDASHVQVGQQVVVTADGLPGREFAGRVSLVLPRMGLRSPQNDRAAEYKDLTFREVLIDLDSWDGLTLNLRVQVRITGPTGS